MTDHLPYTRPRTIGLDADTLGKARTYEAAHSLPAYPEVEPPPELRDRVLAATRLIPQIPACEQVEDGPDIDCLCCNDSGFFVPDFSDLELPCPDCPRGDWTWGHELLDDLERGK